MTKMETIQLKKKMREAVATDAELFFGLSREEAEKFASVAVFSAWRTIERDAKERKAVREERKRAQEEWLERFK